MEKNQRVKIGMKVVPTQKPAKGWEESLENSVICIRAKLNNQPYLFVIGYDPEEHAWILNDKLGSPDDIGGDYFRKADFAPYVEE